jgi:glycerol-3-phosphate dehydrogenase (NAD(P)+)
MTKVIVYGGGAWGTALALTSLRAGHEVSLVVRRQDQAAVLKVEKENRLHLPGIILPESLHITHEIEVIQQADVLLMVTPAQNFGESCARVKPFLKRDTPIVICSKGIDLKKIALLTEVAKGIVDNPLAVLSGPSFADEVGKNLPAAVTVAAFIPEVAERISTILRHPRFRCYASKDPIGVQVGGALKNVLAIACGIVHGRKLGNNTAAALITRGLAEIARLGIAMGARQETFLGLAGVGDLTLTCSSIQSRNMSLGKHLGEGRLLSDILAERQSIAEGVPTAEAVFVLAQKLSVRLPLCSMVYKVLYENLSVDQAIEGLLSHQALYEF